MRLSIAFSFLLAVRAFSPAPLTNGRLSSLSLNSAVSDNAPTASEINARMEEIQKKMELKDKASIELTKEVRSCCSICGSKNLLKSCLTNLPPPVAYKTIEFGYHLRRRPHYRGQQTCRNP